MRKLPSQVWLPVVRFNCTKNPGFPGCTGRYDHYRRTVSFLGLQFSPNGTAALFVVVTSSRHRSYHRALSCVPLIRSHNQGTRRYGLKKTANTYH